MNPRLPGLPTISALMLTSVLTFWLGIWGPTDLNKLKEWQTLSASVIALGAAGIAYLAAVKKVNFDRSVHETEQQRRKENLLLKVRYAAAMFLGKLQHLRKRMEPPFGRRGFMFVAKDIAIVWPPEFQEAWENLDVFSPRAAEMIANLKYNHDFLDAATARLDPATEYQYDWISQPREVADAIKLIKEIETFAEDLLRSL